MIHLMSVVHGVKSGRAKIRVLFDDGNEIENADRLNCVINAEIIALLKTLRNQYPEVFDDALGDFLESEIAGCDYAE